MILQIKTDNPYDVIIEKGLFAKAGSLLSAYFGKRKICIVTDKCVEVLYLDRLHSMLKAAGFDCSVFIIDGGEGSKTMTVAGSLAEFLAEMQFSRSDMVLALGGGVVGDLAGFAASIYMRGIPWIQMPTTVLAAVDSSVGGKTAVNLKEGKNLAGAFHQPSIVLCDPELFSTLSSEIFSEGIAEAIKCAVIADKFMFEDFEIGSCNIETVIAKCIAIKARLVEEDEKDKGRRMLLNLGHTVAHAVEKASAYEIPHGDAVAIGLYAISKAFCSKLFCDRIYRTLTINGLPYKCSLDPEEILAQLPLDKKIKDGKIRIIVPVRIGECEIREMTLPDAREAIAKGLKE